jgi:hypothetical protein
MGKRGPKKRIGDQRQAPYQMPESLITMVDAAAWHSGLAKSQFVAIAVAMAVDNMAHDRRAWAEMSDLYEKNRRMPFAESWLREVPQSFRK